MQSKVVEQDSKTDTNWLTYETRQDYLARISEHLADIYHVDQLYQYFRQNEDWKGDQEIAALFGRRKAELLIKS